MSEIPPGSPTCTIKITQYISVIVGTYSREFEFDPIDISGDELLIDINHTFPALEEYESVINYKIEFIFEDVAGDFWFYEGLITAVDSELGVVRLHNVNNLQDVEKVFSGHLASVQNQWSLSDNESETTLRRVFPYAFGYPEEGENPELVTNGGFDGWDNWFAGDGGGYNDHNAQIFCGDQNFFAFGQNINIEIGKTYTIEFDILVPSGGDGGIAVLLFESEYDIDLAPLANLGWQHIAFDLFFESTDEEYSIKFYQLGWLVQDDIESYACLIDNVSVKEKSN